MINLRQFLAFLPASIVIFILSTSISLAASASLKKADAKYIAGDNVYNVNFVLQNISPSEIEDYFVEIRFTKADKEVKRYSVILKDSLRFKDGNALVSISIPRLTLQKGLYTPIIVLEKRGLGVISFLRLNKVQIVSGSDVKNLDLTCSVDNKDSNSQIQVNCVSNEDIKDSYNIKYTVNPLGSNKVLDENQVNFSNLNDKTFSFDIPVDFAYRGPVDIKISVINQGYEYGTSYIRYNIPGNYANILSLKKDNLNESIELYLNGSLYENGRMAMVGLAREGKTCFVQNIDLTEIAPLHRSISYTGNNSCDGQSDPFAVLYNNKPNITIDDILDYAGLADKGVAMSILEKHAPKSKYDLLSNNVINMLISIIGLTLAIILLLFAFKYKQKKVVGVFAVLVFMSATQVAWSMHSFVDLGRANSFVDSADAPNARFIVNFLNINNEVGRNDNIVFDLAVIDNASPTLEKYPGAEVFVSVNGAPETQAMTASDPATVTVSLPHSLPVGNYNLTFRSPNLCGSAFDYTRFQDAEFDPKDCKFTTPFKVVNSTGSYVRLFANPSLVEVGNSSRIEWYLSSDIRSCTASGDWSGSKSTNAVNYQSTGPLNAFPKTYTYNISCKNSNGDTLTDTATVQTTDACLTCPPSVTKSMKIQADPQLVKTGNSTTLTWVAKGYSSCRVTEDNPSISDSWRGLGKTVSSSPISTKTTYTLSCSDGSVTDKASVTVKIAPKWLEY